MESIINHFKQQRGFEAENVLQQKLIKINEFFRNNHLDSCVLGISGGVDSALVFKLLMRAAKQDKSPIKRIVALNMPIHCIGTTDQEKAKTKAILVHHSVKQDLGSSHSNLVQFKICDLSSVAEQYIAENENTTPPDPWAVGQLASIVRTPNVYYHAAMLQARGCKSIVVGTINRDEGAYIGFYGKASDAMVDLQPIADLHKSEVFALARLLKVPDIILDSDPAGDVWDGKVDEEMIGAPYWFLELYLGFMDFEKSFSFKTFLSANVKNRTQLTKYYSYVDAIEEIHTKNVHKYCVGMPSHFLDVMQRKLPGYFCGW